MIWTKGTHQSAKFQTFDWSRENSRNSYFDRLLLLKLYKISPEKSIEDFCLMTLKSDAKFEEKLIFCFKNHKNLVDFDLAPQILKIRTLTGSICVKYITFDLNKY